MSMMRGLYGKFRVWRTADPNGKHCGCRYFVLDPQHDPIARLALDAYRRGALEVGSTELAEDLRSWLDDLAPAIAESNDA